MDSRWCYNSLSPLIMKNYSMYDLIPLVETWLETEGYSVSVLANRVEGTKKTGVFSSKIVTVFLEDYSGLCSVKMQGETDVCNRLTSYLQSLPPKGIESVPCPYCKTLVNIRDKKCPNCGAYIRG